MTKKERLIQYLIHELDLEVIYPTKSFDKPNLIICNNQQGDNILALHRYKSPYPNGYYKSISIILKSEGYDTTDFDKQFLIKNNKKETRTIKLDERIIKGLAKEYKKGVYEAVIVANICDETLDRSGQLLGEVREEARKKIEKKDPCENCHQLGSEYCAQSCEYK